MKKGFVIYFIVAAVLVSSIALSGCVEEENKIIVGTSADYPPFEYVQGGEIVGFDIELITTLLENLGYTVEVKDIGFDSLVPSLESGKIDVIAAAMTITPERDEKIDFTDSYYNSDQSILVQADSDFNIEEDEDISDLASIGAQTGTTGELWVYDNFINITDPTMNDNQLKRYDTYILAVLDLDNGNIDAVILDNPVAESFAEDQDRKVEYVIQTDEFFGFGIAEGNTELQNGLNEQLELFMESDDWAALLEKYFE
jgi:polar amino acid transport system substrate-binding protein